MIIISKIIFIILVLFIILAGCINRPKNVGVEIQNKVIKVPPNMITFNPELYPNYGNYSPKTIISQAPKNMNGWSAMAPVMVRIIYEKEEIKPMNIDVLDRRNVVIDSTDTDTDTEIPQVSTNNDQYAEEIDTPISTIEDDDSSNSMDE